MGLCTTLINGVNIYALQQGKASEHAIINGVNIHALQQGKASEHAIIFRNNFQR